MELIILIVILQIWGLHRKHDKLSRQLTTIIYENKKNAENRSNNQD